MLENSKDMGRRTSLLIHLHFLEKPQDLYSSTLDGPCQNLRQNIWSDETSKHSFHAKNTTLEHFQYDFKFNHSHSLNFS